jgi:hypothetical protein
MSKTWRSIIDLLGGRKFLVFLIGSGFLVGKLISQEIWLWVVGIYVSGNIAETITDKIKIKVLGE